MELLSLQCVRREHHVRLLRHLIGYLHGWWQRREILLVLVYATVLLHVLDVSLQLLLNVAATTPTVTLFNIELGRRIHCIQLLRGKEFLKLI